MTHLVYLDTETTGLSPVHHQVWEIAWAGADGPITSAVVPHSLDGADPRALEVGGHADRCDGTTQDDQHLYHPRTASRPRDGVELQLFADLNGATIVGANPGFDQAMLAHRWGTHLAPPWHYRALDVEAFAAAVYGWPRPRGLADVRRALARDGWDVPEPDHTAAGDVATVRAAHRALAWCSQQFMHPSEPSDAVRGEVIASPAG